MSSRKKNRHPQPQQNIQAKPILSNAKLPTPQLPTAPTYADQIAQLKAAATAQANEEDFQTIAALPSVSSEGTIENELKECKEARRLFEVQYQRTRREEEQAKTDASRLKEEQAKLDKELGLLVTQKNDLEEKNSQIEAREKAILASEQDLLAREARLRQRELDADAGFAQRNRKALEQLDREAEILQDVIANNRSRIVGERAAWDKELIDRRTALDDEIEHRLQEAAASAEQDRLHHLAKIDEKTSELYSIELRLQSEAAHLRKEAQTIEIEREILKEDRDALEARVERRAAAALERRDAKIVALEEYLSAARQERDELSKNIGAREDAERRFGGRTPEEVLIELRNLRKERDELRQQLGSRPGVEAVQRLEELERQREHWEVEQISLIGEVSELKQDVVRKRIAVTELEGLRNHKAALEASNDLLTKALEDDVRKIKDLVQGADGASPFPSCLRMDNDNDLQTSRPTSDEIRSLRDFAEYVRHCMAYNPITGKKLYYSAEDVRSFIAGLAMSRLHLLHGISGTGKTSLPQAFARAIGAGCALIEVQAGWRDRQDLIGHFNTFERKFYESEFLLALYQAGCPQYRDTPFIIVLDEMNLSHPEQYFADLLSELEQDQQRQRLVLMTAAVEPAPALLGEGGRFLQIPANVWFVGTANQDETTKDFADKTYDRAHVMELPRQKTEFVIEAQQPKHPFSFQALTHAFAKAKDSHPGTALMAWEFLKESLADFLGRRFNVGWGNRLQRQMEDYVPVIIACGGSIGEATDHILATKLLRKIRDRHSNRPEDIIALRDQIKLDWTHLDASVKPEKSLGILGEELHRLGHDEE